MAMTAVTDPVLLKELLRQGIDPVDVDFDQDYAPHSQGKRHSPYSKFYTTKAGFAKGRQFMVISGLPMVDADGLKIECGWRAAGINYFTEKNNLFRGKVQGQDVELIVRNDQPDGRKANDRLTYRPQLFLGGVEQLPQPSILLPVDPVNSSYLENTIEWDYGICKRRLRIIEGHILGCWVFNSNPGGEVRIQYNQTGDYRLKLGRYATDADTEVVTASVFAEADYPFTVSDSATFYPDASPETTSVDGFFFVEQAAERTWGTLQTATDVGVYGSVDDSAANSGAVGQRGGTSSNMWERIWRAMYLFDTSSLPDNATITSATLSIYGSGTQNGGGTSPNVAIYASTPASNTSLVSGDFDQVGSTAFSSAITYANWAIAGYNDLALNAGGLANITVSGISKFSARTTADATNNAPTWASGRNVDLLIGYFSEQGTGYKPKLVVTYTTPAAPTVTTQAVSSVGKFGATGNGNITDTGGANATRRGFCYTEGTSGDPTVADSVAYDDGDFGTGAYTKAITGLKHNTGYRVRAYAVNPGGTGYGTTVQLTTLAATGAVWDLFSWG